MKNNHTPTNLQREKKPCKVCGEKEIHLPGCSEGFKKWFNSPTNPPTETREIEKEANQFAMELLMPEDVMTTKIMGRRDIDLDLSDEWQMSVLVKKYGVPEYWLITRVNQLREKYGKML